MTDIKQIWEDCTIGFECPVCGDQRIADSQNEEMECECGTKYYLSVKLVVTPAEKTKPRLDETDEMGGVFWPRYQ